MDNEGENSYKPFIKKIFFTVHLDKNHNSNTQVLLLGTDCLYW
jgi:hypothetical protein